MIAALLEILLVPGARRNRLAIRRLAHSDAVGSKEWWQRGFALGIAAHGIGTARAFSINAEAGTFASLAMGLHGIVDAVLIPLLVRQ